MIKVYFENLELKPYKKHEDDAGIDLRAKYDVILKAGETKRIETGVTLEMSKGLVGLIKPRSSYGVKGINTTAGVIDAGYRGEISVVLQNHSDKEFEIKKGDRIAQLLIIPCIVEIEFEEGKAPLNSKRGANGFGSTGRR